jgi:16S rRNA (cytosine1402-N4)-methyltransferase
MNPDSDTTAEKILNSCSLDELTRIFREYGEIPGAYRFALRIVEARGKGRISDTRGLLEVLKELIPPHHASKTLAKLYQAIRIEVNGEMEALREMLKQSRDALKEGGRLVVLSYHSLEDRLVKNMIRAGNLEGIIEKDFFGHGQVIFRAINQKVIIPSNEEIRINPRARSAKLRIAERL